MTGTAIYWIIQTIILIFCIWIIFRRKTNAKIEGERVTSLNQITEHTSEPQNVSFQIDFQKFWSFLFRMIAGIGLITFWLFLAGITAATLGWTVISITNLSFAWYLGIGIATIVAIICWWICYHVAIDSLNNIGIELTGFWRWIIIPVALPLAPLLFLFGTISGFGELIRGRLTTILAFSLGTIIAIILVITIAQRF